MLRTATTDDTGRIAFLEDRVFGLDAWTVDAVLGELTGDHKRAAVAEVDSDVIGFVSVSLAGDVADLTRVEVATDVRRLGVGAVLLEWAVQEALDAGAERMLLEVGANNDAAVALYAGAGFSQIARRRAYYADGADALVMERALTR